MLKEKKQLTVIYFVAFLFVVIIMTGITNAQNEEFSYDDESSILGISGAKNPFPPNLMLTLTEAEKIERIYKKFDLVKDVNAHWYRMYTDVYAGFNFHRAKKSEGKYDFSLCDKIVKALQERGISIIVMIGPWRSNFTQEDSPGGYLVFDLDEYKEYVKQAVERYDGDGFNDMPGLIFPINHWEVDSEPDVHYRYGEGTFEPPEEYFTVLKATYESVKKANPMANVIIGAFTLLGQNENKEGREYLENLLDLGAKDYFDYFNIHYFHFSIPIYEDILEYIEEKVNKLVWVEWSFPSVIVDEEKHAEMFEEIYSTSKEKVVKKLAVFEIVDVNVPVGEFGWEFASSSLYACDEQNEFGECTKMHLKKIGESYKELASNSSIEEISSIIPNGLQLNQNYPNPFTQKTVISYSLFGNQDDYTINNLRLTIYDLTGRLVKSFPLTPNSQSLITTVEWDGRDNSGKDVGSGIYFYKLKVNDKFSQTKQILFLK